MQTAVSAQYTDTPSEGETDRRLAHRNPDSSVARRTVCDLGNRRRRQTIHSFIDVHIAPLREAFGVTWRKATAYTTIRYRRAISTAASG